MKKILLCLILCAVIMPSIFARTETDDDFESEKIFGITPGVRLSVLGLEPTLAIDVYNFEIEGTCAFSSGLDGKQFGFAPSLSVAYNTNPYENGSFAVFGTEYMYLTPSYTNMLAKTFDKDKDVDEDLLPGIHSLSFFYKGGVNFNSVFGMLWRVRLPILISGSQDGESFNMNITNLPGFAGCFLIGVCTTSVGVKFTF